MYDILNFKNFAKQLNNLTFTMYYYDLSILALSLFKWDNLPNGIDEKWIEKYLFSYGECMIFNDFEKGLMISRVTTNGVNQYDEPIYLKPYATNYVNDKFYLNELEAILIRNNDLSIPTEMKVQLFAYRLSDITRTQDININAQKTPILIKCTEKQRLSLKNVYTQYSGNEPVIFGDKNLDMNDIDVVNTNAPIVFDKLQIQKHQIMNEFLTFIGVNNANMDKRERLVDDEVQANNEQVECFFNTMLKAREDACKKINDLFGTNIKVSKRIESWSFYDDSEGNSEDDPKVVSDSKGGDE